MTASDSPITSKFAAQGAQWAIKLQTKGWRNLSKAQKREARSHGIGPSAPPPAIPKVNRVIMGNPNNSRRRGGGDGNAQKSMTITKQEFLGTIFSSDSITTYPIDPRNVKTFPQISALALGYNKYKITSLQLRYSTRVTETEANVIMAFTTDSGDLPPRSKVDMYNIGTKFEVLASKPLVATIPVSKDTKYLRDKCSDDSKLVDCGALHFMVDGRHSGRLGELFLQVTIVLSEPTFSQQSTQILRGTTQTGPTLVEFSQSGKSSTYKFLAVGRYVFSAYGKVLVKARQVGMDKAKQMHTSDDKSSNVIAEVEALEPGASIVLDYVEEEPPSFVCISRM
ncbi:putative coat protein [Pelargonium chlorotic ring pattern virus]|uniref:Capsid protein n=1 Tax=Pelargonium chlorotic ring pattern virus TaxID=167021 RepID=Q911J4_9TOMB|nr:putative coat protein [Pelargonium chlorotic ring pattern virus]AAK74064.1 putative coat protein [Pelargonium chlorotic ring pattern virus]